MSSFFAQLDLEMIALESAISAYEVDNNITEDYLNDYSAPTAAPAYESATDDFGFGLFSDMAPATEEAEGTSGGGLGKGIKNILSAVGRFFAKIGEGMKAFFNSFKSKKAQTKDVKVTPAAEKAATNMRGAIKSAVSIIGNITKADTEFMQRICKDIKTAIDSVGQANLDSALNKKIGKRNDEYAKVGAKFVELSGGKENAADADERIQRANEILDKVKKTEKDLQTALDKVSDVFKAELKKAKLVAEAYDERSEKKRSETDYKQSERNAAYDEEDRKKLKSFNDEATRRQSLGVSTANDVKSISMTSLTNQIKQAIFVDYKIEEIAGLCDGVVSACGNLEAFCTKVADKNLDNSGSENSKRAYKLCRILSSASTVYTKLSSAIKELTTGSIFTDNGSSVGSVTTRDDSGSKDEKDFMGE